LDGGGERGKNGRELPAPPYRRPHDMVQLAKQITESSKFQLLIVFLITLSGVLSGIESYLGPQADAPLIATLARIQDAILWIFVVEIALKILACGAQPWRYFANPWNLFDFLIVGVCLLPLDLRFSTVLRMARLVRTLRLITIVPRLQLLVSALLKSIPSLGYIGILLGLHFYMYAVMGTFLFGENDPLRFGSLHQSFLTLFQVLTLEGWNDVLATQYLGSNVTYDAAWAEVAGAARVPSAQPIVAALYFVSFIMLGTMIMLNLFTGVIITSMEEASNEAAEDKRKRHLEEQGFTTLRDELSLVSTRLKEISAQLDAIQLERPAAARLD
jgi:voltage-gated sodium channel